MKLDEKIFLRELKERTESGMEVTKENINNPDALWKWIKREAKGGNIQSIKWVPRIQEETVDNTPFTIKGISGGMLTIELDYPSPTGFIG